MRMTDLIAADAVLPALKVSSKKQALLELSEAAGRVSGLPARAIFDTILQRERLGSTGAGNGIAIPHAKLANASRIFGIFARLEKPIDYDSPDGVPVDLIFLLIAPETAGADHLKALSRIARSLRAPSLTAKLRATRDADGLYALVTQDATPYAA